MSEAKKLINILFLIDELHLGGTENQLIWLIKNLPSDIFSPYLGVLKINEYTKKLHGRISIISFDSPRIPILRNLDRVKLIKDFINKKAIDIVQTQFQNSEIYGVIASKLSKQKPITISTRRNLFHWVTGFGAKLLFFLTKLVVKNVDMVLANSYKVSQLCQELEHIKSSRISVIQNSVDLKSFSQADSLDSRARLNVSKQDIIIGVVANWRPVKGLSVFLDAAALIKKNNKNIRFVLVGHGPQENELKEQCDKLGIRNDVVFLDNTTHIPTIINTFDIAVQPSFSESFSNVLLEYMASSKPIVATCVGDTELVIEDGEEGLLVNPGDVDGMALAIMELVNSHEKRLRFKQNAFRKVKRKWKSDIILQQYLDFYINKVPSISKKKESV